MNPDGNQTSERAQGDVLVIMAARVLSTPLVVYLRSSVGRDYVGLAGVLAAFVVPLFAGAFPGRDPMPTLWFWYGYLAMLVVARIDGLWQRYRGTLIHSHYSGRPRLLILLPFLSERFTKRCVEPVLVVWGGWQLFEWNEPLSSYLVWAGIALAIIENLGEFQERRAMIESVDAYIEQQQMLRRLGRVRPRAFGSR